MPKIRGTKKQLTETLFKRLEAGPSLSTQFLTDMHIPSYDQLKIESEMERQVRNWLRSWVVEDVKRLVPKQYQQTTSQ